MIDPTEQDIGRGVVYTTYLGKGEDGAITSFSDQFVFVHYSDQHPSSFGKATRREDLEWLSPSP